MVIVLKVLAKEGPLGIHAFKENPSCIHVVDNYSCKVAK